MKKPRTMTPTVRLLLVFVVMAAGILTFFFVVSRILIHKPEHGLVTPREQAGATVPRTSPDDPHASH